jgi:hypothetical protein
MRTNLRKNTRRADSGALIKAEDADLEAGATLHPARKAPCRDGRPAGCLLRKAVSLMAVVCWANAGAAADGPVTTTNDFITGVSIFAVSSQNTNRAAVNIINGNGLNSTTREHDTGLNNKL